MPTKQFVSYVDHLTTIEFYKYDVVVNYYDLRLKYKNLGGSRNTTFTLEVKAIVNKVEPREYVLYTKTRSSEEATSWLVRLPEISNNLVPQYDFSGNSRYNVSRFPERQFIDVGLNYDVNTADKYSSEGPVSRYIGIYPNIEIIPGNVSGYDLKLTSAPEPGARFVVTNTAAIFSDFVENNFYRYNREHPCLLVNYDPPPPTGNAPDTEQEYFKIPIGVSRYKITLTNNANQEKVISYLEGSLYANPAYSPIQQMSVSLPPPSASAATLTLNSSQPFPAPSNPNGGPNNNTVITGFTPGGGLVFSHPASYDQGQNPFTGQGGGNTNTGTTTGNTTYTPSVTPGVVPNVITTSRSVARTAIEDAGYRFAQLLGDEAPGANRNGTAYIQSPVAGTNAPTGTTVVVTFYDTYVPGQH